MGRPPILNPSKEALRKREQRKRKEPVACSRCGSTTGTGCTEPGCPKVGEQVTACDGGTRIAEDTGIAPISPGCAPTAGERLIAAAKEAREIAAGRLAPVLVYVPKGDEKATEIFAARLRKAARIPESEVPE